MMSSGGKIMLSFCLTVLSRLFKKRRAASSPINLLDLLTVDSEGLK